MDAKIKSIKITPTKFDKDGDPDKDPIALIQLEVPIDGMAQTEEVMGLFDVLSREWVKSAIYARNANCRSWGRNS